MGQLRTQRDLSIRHWETCSVDSQTSLSEFQNQAQVKISLGHAQDAERT